MSSWENGEYRTFYLCSSSSQESNPGHPACKAGVIRTSHGRDSTRYSGFASADNNNPCDLETLLELARASLDLDFT